MDTIFDFIIELPTIAKVVIFVSLWMFIKNIWASERGYPYPIPLRESDREARRRCRQEIRDSWAKPLTDDEMIVVAITHTDGNCPICGELLSNSTIVTCNNCKTTHHAECWQYNIGCSTYACGCQQVAK